MDRKELEEKIFEEIRSKNDYSFIKFADWFLNRSRTLGAASSDNRRVKIDVLLRKKAYDNLSDLEYRMLKAIEEAEETDEQNRLEMK